MSLHYIAVNSKFRWTRQTLASYRKSRVHVHPIFIVFNEALDAHLTNSFDRMGYILRLPVPARKRNVSFSSSFELGDRHLSHPPRLLLSSPLYSCFPRLAIPFRSGLLVLTPFQGHFVVVSGLRFFVDEIQKEAGVAPFATLSVLTLHAECPRENFSPRDCCFPTMFLLKAKPLYYLWASATPPWTICRSMGGCLFCLRCCFTLYVPLSLSFSLSLSLAFFLFCRKSRVWKHAMSFVPDRGYFDFFLRVRFRRALRIPHSS